MYPRFVFNFFFFFAQGRERAFKSWFEGPTHYPRINLTFVYVSVLHESDVIWLLLKIFSLVGGLLFGPANILVEYIPLYGRAREQVDDYADGIWVFLLA